MFSSGFGLIGGLLVAVLLALAAGLTVVAYPLVTPVTEANAKPRLTTACRLGAAAYRKSEGVALPEGACGCVVEAMSETLPAAELAAEAEQIRRLALLGLAAALDRGEKRARFISERRRLVAENALFDEERQEIVANRCDAELEAAAALAEAAEEP